jgi:hypothetical protein
MCRELHLGRGEPPGWGESHPAARAGVIPPTAVMLYAPRDDDELSIIETLIRASRTFAGGG